MEVKQFIFNPFQENTYVVWSEPSMEAVIIDCGAATDSEREELEYFIENKDLKIKHLINTHLHLDHCFGNAWAAEKWNVPTKASESDHKLLKKLPVQAAAFGVPEEYVRGGSDAFSAVSEGDVIEFGDCRLEVIETPGHTEGGVCFYEREEAVLFAGDSLFNGSVGRTDLPGGSYKDLINSLQQKVVVLPGNVKVYCGHGPYTFIDDEKKYNPYL